MKGFTATQWLALLVATTTATFTLAAYSHSVFSTVREVNTLRKSNKEAETRIEKRLDRMNKKLDDILKFFRK